MKKPFLRGWPACTLCTLALAALGAQAQDDAVTQTIVVSASRNDTALLDMPTHTTGAQTKIRGLGNAKVLVLLDGVPILDPFYLTTQWFRVPKSTIERVEIMRGEASSLWSSMAVGGVVNIITRKPKDDSGEVSAGYGSFGTRNLAASKNVRVSDALNLGFSIDAFHTAGYQTTPAQYLWLYPGKQAPSDTAYAYQASARFHPNEVLDGFLRLGYFTQDQNLYGVFGRNLQKSPDLSAGLTAHLDGGSRLDGRLWAQNVSFDKTNGASCYLVSSSSCLNGGSGTLPTAAQAAASPVVNYYSQQGDQAYSERGASLTYARALGGLVGSVQWGADYRRLSVDDTEQYYTAPTAAHTQNLSGTATGTGTQTFTGLFAQAQLRPVDALRITISGRYDAWANTGRSYSLDTAAHGVSPGSGPAADTTKSQFNPTLGLHYDVDDRFALRGSAFRAFRAPGLNNQTRSYGSTIANPDLSPETVTGGEFGGDFHGERLSLGLTVFSNKITNMIATSTYTLANTLPQPVINLCSTAPLGSAPNLTNCSSSVTYYSNAQNGRASGVEIDGKLELRRNWTLDAAYALTSTWLTSEWNGVKTPLQTQLVGIPKSTFSLASRWSPSKTVSTYVQLFYIGPLSYYQSGSVNANQGSNTVLNASVKYQVNAATDVSVDGVNLFNRSYQDGSYTASQPQGMTLSPPRTLNVGLRYRF